MQISITTSFLHGVSESPFYTLTPFWRNLTCYLWQLAPRVPDGVIDDTWAPFDASAVPCWRRSAATDIDRGTGNCGDLLLSEHLKTASAAARRPLTSLLPPCCRWLTIWRRSDRYFTRLPITHPPRHRLNQLQWRRSVVKIGGPKLLFSKILFSFVYLHSPYLPLPLKVGPLKCSQVVIGSAVSSPNGVWGAAKSNFVHFYPQKSDIYSGNDSNDFPENQLAKFRKV